MLHLTLGPAVTQTQKLRDFVLHPRCHGGIGQLGSDVNGIDVFGLHR